MTDVIVPDYVWDKLIRALKSPDLNGPVFEPDGGITWDNGDSIVLGLYSQSHFDEVTA